MKAGLESLTATVCLENLPASERPENIPVTVRPEELSATVSSSGGPDVVMRLPGLYKRVTVNRRGLVRNDEDGSRVAASKGRFTRSSLVDTTNCMKFLLLGSLGWSSSFMAQANTRPDWAFLSDGIICRVWHGEYQDAHSIGNGEVTVLR